MNHCKILLHGCTNIMDYTCVVHRVLTSRSLLTLFPRLVAPASPLPFGPLRSCLLFALRSQSRHPACTSLHILNRWCRLETLWISFPGINSPNLAVYFHLTATVSPNPSCGRLCIPSFRFDDGEGRFCRRIARRGRSRAGDFGGYGCYVTECV